MQSERQEAERNIGQLQEQINQLLLEAQNAAAESTASLGDAKQKAAQEIASLQVCFSISIRYINVFIVLCPGPCPVLSASSSMHTVQSYCKPSQIGKQLWQLMIIMTDTFKTLCRSLA